MKNLFFCFFFSKVVSVTIGWAAAATSLFCGWLHIKTLWVWSLFLHDLKFDYFSTKEYMFDKLKNICIRVSNFMTKKKLQTLLIGLAVIIDPWNLFWDINILFLSVLEKLRSCYLRWNKSTFKTLPKIISSPQKVWIVN